MGALSLIHLYGDGEMISYCAIGDRDCTTWFVPPHLLGREPAWVVYKGLRVRKGEDARRHLWSAHRANARGLLPRSDPSRRQIPMVSEPEPMTSSTNIGGRDGRSCS